VSLPLHPIARNERKAGRRISGHARLNVAARDARPYGRLFDDVKASPAHDEAYARNGNISADVAEQKADEVAGEEVDANE
jgi:hypothetical protein